jgi:uncharacterized protein (TIGR02246 family)
MKRSVATLCAVLVLGFAASVKAGPAEEVAQIAGARGAAFESGNLDAWMAAFADNAVLQAFMSPFRVEGKDAIRAHFAQLFLIYPTRLTFVRQPTTRVYNDDLVVQDAYLMVYFTDQVGQTMATPIRSSTTWAKLGGRWQVVDTHVSRVPTP